MAAYKLDKSLLFSVPSSEKVSGVTLAIVPAEVVEGPAVPPQPSLPSHTAGVPTNFLSVDLVRAATKTLWWKSKKGPVSKKEGRAKLLKLLQWLCGKHGWGITLNAPQSYRNRSLLVDGWAHARISSEGRSICVEICYDLDEPTLFKLWAAHVSGSIPLLVWMGAPAADIAFDTKLRKFFANKPIYWLRVLQIEAV